MGHTHSHPMTSRTLSSSFTYDCSSAMSLSCCASAITTTISSGRFQGDILALFLYAFSLEMPLISSGYYSLAEQCLKRLKSSEMPDIDQNPST